MLLPIPIFRALFRAIDVELPFHEAGRLVLRLEMDLPYRSKVGSNRRIPVVPLSLLPNSRLSSRVDLFGGHI